VRGLIRILFAVFIVVAVLTALRGIRTGMKRK